MTWEAGAGRERESRRPFARVLLAAALAALALLTCAVALRGTAPLYPTGDFAILELYTRNAAAGPWPFGPYSRFGWHHPGPLFFYWEVPWYLVSGERSLGMHAGALALSVTILSALLTLVARGTPPTVGLAAALGFAVYLLRLGGLAIDVWNPLVVVVPMALVVVLGAALAAGRWRLLPWLVVAASFVVQTHVSVVPAVAVVMALSLWLAWRGRGDVPAPAGWRRPVVTAAVCGAAVWALPLAAVVRGEPGHLGELVTFFAQSAPPVSWARAAGPWSALLTAPFSPELRLPQGGEDATPLRGATMAVAALQLAGLVVVAWTSARARQAMLSALAVLGGAVVLVAWWSLTRVRGPIGEYLAFWLSAVAVLNWSVILGGMWTAWPSLPAAAARLPRLVRAVGVAVIALVAIEGARHIARVGAVAAAAAGTAGQVPAMTDAVETYLRSRRHARPRINVAGLAWPQAAGVVLELHKRGVPVSVEGDVAFVFSAPPDGREDTLLGLADPATATRLRESLVEIARTGDLVLVAPRP